MRWFIPSSFYTIKDARPQTVCRYPSLLHSTRWKLQRAGPLPSHCSQSTVCSNFRKLLHENNKFLTGATPFHTDDNLTSLEKESGLQFLLSSQGTSLSDDIFLLPHMPHLLERTRAQGVERVDPWFQPVNKNSTYCTFGKELGTFQALPVHTSFTFTIFKTTLRGGRARVPCYKSSNMLTQVREGDIPPKQWESGSCKNLCGCKVHKI